MDDAAEIKWLVKTGGKIKGPYSPKEINKKLLTRDFVVLDEVMSPYGNWKFIRDEHRFIQIVEEIRRQNSSVNDDDTATIATDTFASDTMTLSQSSTDVLDSKTDPDYRTEEIPFNPKVVGDEIVVDDVVESRTRPAGDRSTRGYGMAGDVSARHQAKKTARNLWYITTGILVLAVGFVAFNRLKTRPAHKRTQVINHVAEAKRYMRQGQPDIALAHFKQAHQLKPDDKSIYLYLGVLLPNIEGSTLEAKRLLKTLSRKDADYRKTRTALGLIELMDGRQGSAESYFKQVNESDKSYTPAILNLATIALQRGDFQQGRRFLQQARAKGERDGVLALASAEMSYRAWRIDGDKQELSRAVAALAEHMAKSSDYRQEIMIVRNALVNTLSGIAGTADDDSQLKTVLDIDPRQTELHSHNLFVYRSDVVRRVYTFWCQEMTKSFPGDEYAKALDALCASKVGKLAQARTLIESALKRSPQDAILHSVNAHILDLSGMDLEQGTAIGSAVKNNRSKDYVLPTLLQARFDQESGDLESAERGWREVYSSDNNSLAALAGLARVYSEQGDVEQALIYLRRGVKLSEDYRPLLKLKSKLGSDEL